MSSFAVAHLRSVTMGPDIVEYLTRIDATLEPYGGRFVVHSGDVEVLEGHWPGHLIVIEFPDREHARSWYASPAYQRILRLRTDNSDGTAILVDGCHDEARPHRATDVLADPPVAAQGVSRTGGQRSSSDPVSAGHSPLC